MHVTLVYADNEEEATRKACVYRDQMRFLDVYHKADYFEVDYLDEEKILSCGDDIKAYLVHERKGLDHGKEQILYGKSAAEIRRILSPYEGEGEIVISALPKIHDIIL